MPRLNDETTNLMNINGKDYQYSAVRVENLGATEYTLVQVIVDTSGSVSSYEKELGACLAEIVKACRKSPRADNLMLRFCTFNHSGTEVHGYKLLTNCNPDDYLMVKASGNTALYDAVYDAASSSMDYAKILNTNDLNVNGILFCITDGEDNSSAFTPTKVKNAFENIVKSEHLESFVSVLIGVGTGQISSYLSDFKDKAGFTQFVEIGNADAKNLAKLAAFISKSISSQSSALGSGGASKQISLTI
jgi:hypothetical protein